MKTGRLVAVLIAVTMMLAGAWAWGQDQDQNQNNDPGGPSNPPGSSASNPQEQTADGESRGEAARVSYISGDVSMQRGDSSGWTAVTVNTPLVQGDQIATGDNSRAEIQLDYAHVLRLAAQSQAKMANLSRNQIQVQIAQGYANVSVLKGGEASVEVDSPNVAVHPLGPGRFRVQVNSDVETDVIVRSGEVEVSTPQGSTRVNEGQLVTVRGTDNPEYKVVEAPTSDDWDRWNRDRDRNIQTASSWHNTNRYYTGSNDLDANGRWVDVPGYGNVWQPYDQGPNWAPYQDGRWEWEPYWGWTWVSYEPWGWAPYHYGRWFYWNTGWAWWPGPIYPYYRPLWAPAFVTFFGFGGHVGFGFGFGTIGWCPVGPFDPFFPWYGRGFRNVNVVNINVINVHNVNGAVAPLGIRGRQPVFSNVNMALTNPRVRGGITTVSSADFGRGVTGSRRFGVSAGDLHQAHVMTGNVGVVPTHESLQPGRGDANSRSSTIRPSSNDHFFSRNTPGSRPTAFHEQAAQVQRVMQGNGGEAMRTGGTSMGAHIPGATVPHSVDAGNGHMIKPMGSNGGSTAGNGGEAMRTGGTSMGAHIPGATVSHSVDAGNGRMIKPMGSNGGSTAGKDGWHGFEGNGQHGTQTVTPPANRNMEMPRGRGNESSGNNSSSSNGWSKFTPSAGGSAGNGMHTESMNTHHGSSGSYKPPLEMSKPLVTPRDTGRNSSTPSYRPDVRSMPNNTQPPHNYSSGQYDSPSNGSSYGGRGPTGSYNNRSTYNGGYYGGRSPSPSYNNHSTYNGGSYRGGGYSGSSGSHSSYSGGSHSSYSGGQSSSGGHNSSGGHSSSSHH